MCVPNPSIQTVWATIVIFTMDVLSHMLRFSVAMVLFMCLFSNPQCTGYNYVKFIALSGRSLTLAHSLQDGELCNVHTHREMDRDLRLHTHHMAQNKSDICEQFQNSLAFIMTVEENQTKHIRKMHFLEIYDPNGFSVGMIHCSLQG